jgi:drug/metabolite transporter (DMT)-like permease
LWNQAIPALGVAVTNNLLYGIPLVGVITGVAALGEPLTANVFISAALIIGGVLLACRKQTSDRKRPDSSSE